jgi:hypothetical protein
MNSDFCHGKLNMPGIDEHQPFLCATFINATLDVASDVDEGPAGWYLEPEFFSVTFHFGTS